jgi:protein-disulfide isomerase
MMISRTPERLVLLTLLFAGCSSTSAQQTPQQLPSDVVGKVGSTSITLAQVDERALKMPTDSFGSTKLVEALYEARRSALDEIINDALIDADAKTRGFDRTKLLDQEINSKIAQPTEAEIAAWYQQNPDRVQGATLDQVRAPIGGLLVQQRTAVVREAYLKMQKGKATINITLQPPRQTIATAGRPQKGPANAPIELIEFADFQCPYCLRALPTLQQVLATYGDRIHFVYRHYPLQNHPNARPAAEAAECAAEQEKFWQYYDVLFGDPSKLSVDDLKASAARLDMDGSRFNACVDSRKYKAAVDTDIKDGTNAGVSGTPAFFINGRTVSGAQPFEVFKQVIDEELLFKNR